MMHSAAEDWQTININLLTYRRSRQDEESTGQSAD